MRIAGYLLLFVAMTIRSSWAIGGVTEVIYTSDDPRFTEYIETLRTALDKTVASHGPYTMRPAGVDMNEVRMMSEVREGKRLNVIWAAASRENEAMLRPIRIPLSKGMLGYRIALIRADTQKKMDAVNSLADLRQYSFGLGVGWGDIPIFKAAGLQVQTNGYESLFKMLSVGRFDLFSRGVNEVFKEYDLNKAQYPNLAVEQHVLLHYRYPYYLFVTPAQPALAERIETGMRQMIKDGSYDRIFRKHNGAAIEKARLAQRVLIEIDNPDLPVETPINDPALWYRPSERR